MLMIKYSCNEVVFPPGFTDMGIMDDILKELAYTRPR